MALSDELQRLADLHASGALTAEEFQQAKARLLDGGSAPEYSAPPAGAWFNNLRRSKGDRWLGGVCGGISDQTALDTWVWRLGFALLFFFWGTGLLLYILLWIFVPEE